MIAWFWEKPDCTIQYILNWQIYCFSLSLSVVKIFFLSFIVNIIFLELSDAYWRLYMLLLNHCMYVYATSTQRDSSNADCRPFPMIPIQQSKQKRRTISCSCFACMYGTWHGKLNFFRGIPWLFRAERRGFSTRVPRNFRAGAAELPRYGAPFRTKITGTTRN